VDGPDTDEFVILSRKFNDMIKRLRFMSDQQKDFISNASHELKTPLSLAISNLDVMNQKYKLPESMEAMTDLFELNNLIEKLLFLSKIRKEDNKVIETVNLVEAVNKSLAGLDKEIKAKGLRIEQSLHKEAYIKLPKEYAQVLVTNLVSNAVKYSPSGSGISMFISITGVATILEITDTGVGMDETDVKNIFLRFYRGKERVEKGHGIGLAIVKAICDLYDIDIKIASKKNSGTTFTVFFKN
ncbi:MAG: HAMP domain-containing sensor histidine kinase, partial [Patescibacteria group bacterium]